MNKPWDLRVGRWQDVLSDVERVDLVCADPPFGERVHRGYNSATDQVLSATGQKTRTEINYTHWTPTDVQEFVAYWSPRCAGWMACITSHDLIPVWEDAYTAAGRLAFAPVWLLIFNPRLLGDGPSSPGSYLMVARHRTRAAQKWRTVPAWYGPFYPGVLREQGSHIGGKPLGLMRSIVRDYSNPGQTILDPCCGAGTTLIAACQEGRTAIGAECDPATAHKAVRRILASNLAPPLLYDTESREQMGMFAAAGAPDHEG